MTGTNDMGDVIVPLGQSVVIKHSAGNGISLDGVTVGVPRAPAIFPRKFP